MNFDILSSISVNDFRSTPGRTHWGLRHDSGRCRKGRNQLASVTRRVCGRVVHPLSSV